MRFPDGTGKHLFFFQTELMGHSDPVRLLQGGFLLHENKTAILWIEFPS